MAAKTQKSGMRIYTFLRYGRNVWCASLGLTVFSVPRTGAVGTGAKRRQKGSPPCCPRCILQSVHPASRVAGFSAAENPTRQLLPSTLDLYRLFQPAKASKAVMCLFWLRWCLLTQHPARQRAKKAKKRYFAHFLLSGVIVNCCLLLFVFNVLLLYLYDKLLLC